MNQVGERTTLIDWSRRLKNHGFLGAVSHAGRVFHLSMGSCDFVLVRGLLPVAAHGKAETDPEADHRYRCLSLTDFSVQRSSR